MTVTFTELVPKRLQVGTDYDFIEKKVVPVYDYDVDEVGAGTVRVTTAADGSWTASVPAAPQITCTRSRRPSATLTATLRKRRPTRA